MAAGEAPVVLARKLLVPQARPEAIVRPRLVRALDAARARPLTVLSAPAGYGKTTALVEWLAAGDAASAWLSLDAGDNDPRRLLAHLLAALERALPGEVGRAAEALGSGSDDDSVLALALDDLSEHLEDGLIVVLDDCHAIEHPRSLELLAELVDSAPPPVRVVISSRTAPPLRLGRRRAAGAVAEIGPAQLRFRRAECAALLNGSLGLELEPDEIERIDHHLDGWAAGLSLVAASLAEQGDRAALLRGLSGTRSGLGRNVADYLVEEVLEATAPRLRDFLFRSSILERLNASLCEAVVDDPLAPALLAEVRRSNLFVTALGPTGEWLRYHRVFAGVLQRELCERAPGLVAELHRRAAEWFEEAGMVELAIHHAGAAGDGRRAARLLADGWRALLGAGRYVTVRRIIERLPRDRGELGNLCAALDAFCMSIEGAAPELVKEQIERLEEVRGAPGVAPIIDLMRVNPFYGDVGGAVEAGRSAWERYATQPEMRLELAGPLGAVLWFAGDRDGVRELVGPRVRAIPHPAGRCWALAALALVDSDDGDAEHAELHAREAVALAEASTEEAGLAFSLAHVALGTALQAQGALAEAGHSLASAARVTGRLSGSVHHALTLVCQARLHLARRDRGRARLRSAAARAIVDRFADVGTLAQRLARVERALAGEGADALLGSVPTAAEQRVLELLPGELSIADIAGELYLSPNTVKSHVRRLYRRLGQSSRDGAVAAARERGLL